LRALLSHLWYFSNNTTLLFLKKARSHSKMGDIISEKNNDNIANDIGDLMM